MNKNVKLKEKISDICELLYDVTTLGYAEGFLFSLVI